MHTKQILVVIGALVVGFALGNFWCDKDASQGDQSGMHGAMSDMMAGLHGKSGDAFDQAFLSEMIMHHEGAVEMAEAALMHAKHEEIKQLAHAIITAQNKEIEDMRRWEQVWYGDAVDASAQELTGTPWVWRTTIVGGDAVVEPSTPDVFTLTFDVEGRVSGTTDCNSFSGSYTREGEIITIGPLASTKMFCADSQESQFTGALTEGPLTISFEGDDVLVLRFSEATALFFDRTH